MFSPESFKTFGLEMVTGAEKKQYTHVEANKMLRFTVKLADVATLLVTNITVSGV